MAETLTRRYGRMIDEGTPLPDLIVVDGGKGQLSAAYGVLTNLGIADKVQIVGLAKRLEEIFYPGDSTPLYLDKRNAKGADAHTRRSSPFRHHVPSQQTIRRTDKKPPRKYPVNRQVEYRKTVETLQKYKGHT